MRSSDCGEGEEADDDDDDDDESARRIIQRIVRAY